MDPCLRAMNDTISKPLAALLQSYAQNQARNAIRLMSSKRPNNDVIHQTRKICKRLRALIVLLREPLGQDRANELEDLVRCAGRRLTALRESAARLETLDRLVTRHPAQAEALWSLRNLLVLRKKNSSARQALMMSRSYLLAALEKISSLTLPPLDPETLDRAVAVSYRRARQALRRIDKADAESVHEWRKKLRRHTDQCKLLASLWPALTGRRHRDLRTINDALGHHHDLADLRNEIDRCKASLRDRDIVLQLLSDEQAALISKACRDGQKLLKTKAARWSAASPGRPAVIGTD